MGLESIEPQHLFVSVWVLMEGLWVRSRIDGMDRWPGWMGGGEWWMCVPEQATTNRIKPSRGRSVADDDDDDDAGTRLRDMMMGHNVSGSPRSPGTLNMRTTAVSRIVR
jgi:hypothetical protein